MTPRTAVVVAAVLALATGRPALAESPEVDRSVVEARPSGALPARPAAAAIFEAEDARRGGASVAANHRGFTGRGFVDFDSAPDAYIEWVIDAPLAGRAELGFRYSNDSRSERPIEVTVNGGQHQLLYFASTGSWDAWFRAVYTPLLVAGRNRIRVTTTTRQGGPNIDSMDGALIMRTIDHQAEDAALSRAAVENEHPGYTGRGYVNTQNEAGGYVEWTINAPATGWYGLGWVTANATSQDRTTTLTINGEVVTADWLFRSVSGSWSVWEDSALTVALTAGANTVRMTANTSDGGPNYDRLLLYIEP